MPAIRQRMKANAHSSTLDGHGGCGICFQCLSFFLRFFSLSCNRVLLPPFGLPIVSTKQTLVAAICLTLISCAEKRATAPELVGTWQNTFMTLESADIPESDPRFEFFVATSNNWERVMGFKPVRTTYQADGTFSAEYRDLQDSVFAMAKGTWYTEKDSLYFFQWEPDTFAATYQYAVVLDTLTLRGIVDWERDGLLNDLYFGRHSKLVFADSMSVSRH